MDSGQPTADSGQPAISLIHRMNAVDFLYHPVQAAGAVGREDLKEGVPFFFALEMGINEDRACFCFVAVQNVKFRGVDETVEIGGPVLFQSEGEEAVDGVAEHGAVHIHRIPFHHPQILETLQPIFGGLAGHKYLFPQFRHGNAAVFLQLINNFSVRIIQFFRNHGFFPFLFFPYYIIAGKEAGLGLSLNNELMSRGWTGPVKVLPFTTHETISLSLALPRFSSFGPALQKWIDTTREVLGISPVSHHLSPPPMHE